MKKIAVFMVLLAFCFSITGCATLSEGSSRNLSKSETLRLEKEKQYNLIKGISTIGGFVIGGMVGIFTAPDSQKLSSMLKGCVIGAAFGFGTGYVVTENIKNNEQKPNASKADEYFKEYEQIKARDNN